MKSRLKNKFLLFSVLVSMSLVPCTSILSAQPLNTNFQIASSNDSFRIASSDSIEDMAVTLLTIAHPTAGYRSYSVDGNNLYIYYSGIVCKQCKYRLWIRFCVNSSGELTGMCVKDDSGPFAPTLLKEWLNNEGKYEYC